VCRTMLNNDFSYLIIDENTTLGDGLNHLRKRLHDLNQSNNPDQPLFIKILERPHRFISLPFQIDLFNHDCIHVLLGIGTYMHDEAFLIGFTMRNSERINYFGKGIYKFITHNLYPKKYGLTRQELVIFDLGYQYGESIRQKGLDRFNFNTCLDTEISALRRRFNIYHYGLMLNDYLEGIQIEQNSFRVADALM
jgi:hypothetical protein